MRTALIALSVTVATQAGAQNFYCEGEIGYEIEKKEQQRHRHQKVKGTQ